MSIEVTHHFAPNDDGWLLHLRRTVPSNGELKGNPILIVPGYGMNSFIFSYHPRGTSMERCLAETGLEVWSVDLRKQGESRPQMARPPGPSLRAYADIDLPAAIAAVLSKTETGADRIDVIGCSLGGSVMYAHIALHADHRIGKAIAVGSPLAWRTLNPLLKFAFSSPNLVRMVRFSGTRRMARFAFPLLAKTPVLGMYANPANVDLSDVGTLVQTVEDPEPRVNADIAHWMKHGDMVLRGVNVTEGIGNAEIPLLLVISNRDGIVPEDTALAAAEHWGGSVDKLHIGDDTTWFAHADLFVGNTAPAEVFAPIAKWLHTSR